MNNDLKMIFLTKVQCEELMRFIADYFENELGNHDDVVEWAWNMADIYKKLEEVVTNESNIVK